MQIIHTTRLKVSKNKKMPNLPLKGHVRRRAIPVSANDLILLNSLLSKHLRNINPPSFRRGLGEQQQRNSKAMVVQNLRHTICSAKIVKLPFFCNLAVSSGRRSRRASPRIVLRLD
jgi:hypothetical protein